MHTPSVNRTNSVRVHYGRGRWSYTSARELTVDGVMESLLRGEVEAYEFFVSRDDLRDEIGYSLPEEEWGRTLEYPSVVVECYEEEGGVECAFEFWLTEREYDSKEYLGESDARALIEVLIGVAGRLEAG